MQRERTAFAHAPIDAIPDLAVVELVRERGGRSKAAIGVVLAADGEHDSYTVELVNADGGRELVAASGGELRVLRLI